MSAIDRNLSNVKRLTHRSTAHGTHARSKTRHTNGIEHKSNETHDWAVLLPLALPPDLPPVILFLFGEQKLKLTVK